MLRVFAHSNCNNGGFSFNFKKGLCKCLNLWPQANLPVTKACLLWDVHDDALLPYSSKAFRVSWIRNFCLASILYSIVQSRSQTLQNMEWAEIPVLNWDSSAYYFRRIRKTYYSFLKIVRYDEVSIGHLEPKWLVMNWKCLKKLFL